MGMARCYRRGGICDSVIMGFKATGLSRAETYGVAGLTTWICAKHLSVLCRARKFIPASITE